MKNRTVKIKELSPLLMRRFSENDQEQATTGIRQPIDHDLTPREVAKSGLYLTEDGKIYFPGSNIYRSFIDAGTHIKNGRSKLSTRDSSQIPTFLWVNEEQVLIEPQEWEVDSRPVVIPATKGRIIRHRPRFDKWELQFTITFDEKLQPETMIRQIIEKAGSYCGLGDFRPNRRGPFGRFSIVEFK